MHLLSSLQGPPGAHILYEMYMRSHSLEGLQQLTLDKADMVLTD